MSARSESPTLTRAAQVLRDSIDAEKTPYEDYRRLIHDLEWPLAAADMLDRLAPLEPYWSEPYAAPFVSVIEAGMRLADAILAISTRRREES